MLPILDELNQELKRVYIAGSALAKGDPRLTKYIAPLEKLGERAPVFANLAGRLKALTECGEKETPALLMDCGVLLYSILHTQGGNDRGHPMEDPVYAQKPLVVSRLPYSHLSRMMETLTKASQAHSEELGLVWEQRRHNDPRLYKAYCQAIGDARTYNSTLVAEQILPDIGREAVPFLREAIDLQGGKADARRFRVLSDILGADILPLAEQALTEGSQPVIIEALYALGQDAAYEDTLLGYLKDRKSDVRQAALTALVRMGSEKGDKHILDTLGKASIGHLAEALAITQNPAIVDSIHQALLAAIPTYDKHTAKVRTLMQVCARREEEAGLHILERYIRDDAFYAKAAGPLEFDAIFRILDKARSPQKWELLHRISDGNGALSRYYVHTCVQLYAADRVYDLCTARSKIIGSQMGNLLAAEYGLSGAQDMPDAQKNWDERWGLHFVMAGNFYTARRFLYDRDRKGWKYLLEKCAAQVKQSNRRTSFYGEVLARAMKLEHPDAPGYYKKYLDAGYPKEMLDAQINAQK